MLAWHHTLLDFTFVCLILFSSFSLGCKFKIYAKRFDQYLLQLAIGLGLIGFITFMILSIGIGNKILFTILILTPLVIN